MSPQVPLSPVLFLYCLLTISFAQQSNNYQGTTGPDPAANQLPQYAKENQNPGNYSTGSGEPVFDPGNVMTAGQYGPVVLQDSSFLNEMQHFDRERIPERVVHAKGSGAFGNLVITSTEITRYSAARVFSDVGKTTPVFVRFSQVAGETGSADTVRDFRGFAVKFYTEEGNWDLVGINQPVFWIRDPFLFPSFVHSQKRNPATNLHDWNMFWDFLTLEPMTTLAMLLVHSRAGIPRSYRFMNGHGPNTFSLVDQAGNIVYCKFHLLSNQGLGSLDPERALSLAGSDPDYYMRDLYNSIATGQYPSWNLTVQVMTVSQAANFTWNPFDVTKLWPTSEVPMIEVGILTLDGNPDNYFARVEQAGFDPQRLPPGIEPSPDKLLQGRLFSYTDTQMHRLGVNNELIPVNRPINSPRPRNRYRDGFMRTDDNQDGSPNYYPTSFNGPRRNPRGKQAPFPVQGNVAAYDTSGDDNFSQATMFWRGISSTERENIINNMAATLSQAAPTIQERAVELYRQVGEDLSTMLSEALNQARLNSS